MKSFKLRYLFYEQLSKSLLDSPSPPEKQKNPRDPDSEASKSTFHVFNTLFAKYGTRISKSKSRFANRKSFHYFCCPHSYLMACTSRTPRTVSRVPRIVPRVHCAYFLVTRASDLMAAHDPRSSSFLQSCAKRKSSGVEIVKCSVRNFNPDIRLQHSIQMFSSNIPLDQTITKFNSNS